MEILIILIFILGLCIGSFLNVLIYRLPLDLSLKGRSFCPKCKKKISWYDNIPLLSFVLLKGKCRYCHSPISFQYPFVEALTGILFVISFFLLFNTNHELRIMNNGNFDYGFWITLFFTFWVLSAFLAIFIIDLKHQIIPDQLIISSLVAVIFYEFIIRDSSFILHIMSAAAASLFFYFLYKITKEKGMGFGDVKLVFLMGLILGYPDIVLALYLAFLTGAVVGVILIIARIKKLKQPIAFGPFLSLATIVSYFWGTEILKWITALLF
jgi:prepilin signal peptidase PulO-like enzyme (type II secretory pathway)